MDLLLWVGGVGCGCEDDVAFVDGDVLFGRGGDADLELGVSSESCAVCVALVTALVRAGGGGGESTYLPCLALSLVHNTLLHKPQPVREGAVQQEVGDYGGRGVRL